MLSDTKKRSLNNGLTVLLFLGSTTIAHAQANISEDARKEDGAAEEVQKFPEDHFEARTAKKTPLKSPPASKELPKFPFDDPLLEPIPDADRTLTSWERAIEIVRSRSADYRRAAQQVEIARGNARMVLAGVLPTLIGDLQYTRYLNEFPEEGGPFGAEPDNWSAGATLRVPLVSARGWYEYATARDSVKRTMLDVSNAQRLIIGDLAENLVTVVTTEKLSEVTKVNLRVALSNMELAERRTRLGSGNRIDVLRARQEVIQSRAEVIAADEALTKAREALGLALGSSEPWGVTKNLKLDQLRKDARRTCSQSESVESRADVRAAEAGAAIAKRKVNSVMLGFVPQVDAHSRVNYSASNNFFFPDTTWTIGATLTWHLYDGGLRYGERQRNIALHAQAEQDAQESKRKAQQEVSQVTRGINVASASLGNAVDARDVAKENSELARARFINGTGTSFDMVDTQSFLRRAELDVTVKEYELLRAEIIAFLALASCEL